MSRSGSTYSTPRDANRVPFLTAASTADGVTPIVLEADPTTHALGVSISGTITAKDVRSTTPTQTSVSVTNVTTSVLALNVNRLGATFYNEGTAICYLKLGSTASITSYTIQIASGGYYELPFNFTGAIDGITSASTAQLRITELS